MRWSTIAWRMSQKYSGFDDHQIKAFSIFFGYLIFFMIRLLENSSLIRIYLVPMQFSLLYEYLHEYFYFVLGPHNKLWGWGLVWRVKVHILEDERAPCIMSLAFSHLYMQLTFGWIPIWWTAEFNHGRRHLSLLVQMSQPLTMILSGGGEYNLCTYFLEIIFLLGLCTHFRKVP